MVNKYFFYLKFSFEFNLTKDIKCGWPSAKKILFDHNTNQWSTENNTKI